MPWAQPENITGLTSLFVYVVDIFPYFPYLSLVGIFFVLVMAFNRSAPIPNAITAAAFMTWTFSVFMFAMSVISGYAVVFIGVGTAFCLLWTRLAQSSSLG